MKYLTLFSAETQYHSFINKIEEKTTDLITDIHFTENADGKYFLSYDSCVLLSELTTNVSFKAKRELTQNDIIGTFIYSDEETIAHTGYMPLSSSFNIMATDNIHYNLTEEMLNGFGTDIPSNYKLGVIFLDASAEQEDGTIIFNNTEFSLLEKVFKFEKNRVAAFPNVSYTIDSDLVWFDPQYNICKGANYLPCIDVTDYAYDFKTGECYPKAAELFAEIYYKHLQSSTENLPYYNYIEFYMDEGTPVMEVYDCTKDTSFTYDISNEPLYKSYISKITVNDIPWYENDGFIDLNSDNFGEFNDFYCSNVHATMTTSGCYDYNPA